MSSSHRVSLESSSGALIGLLAVLGYSPHEMIGMVRRELYSRPLSPIPGGKYLNMLRMLRGGHLARRLRRYCPFGLPPGVALAASCDPVR